ncbi:MAG TPA: hypothetical protein VLI04_22900 [Nocardioidaceae bacterium]|nr:hypothetical protein [Nocardioidaceae bacterium]
MAPLRGITVLGEPLDLVMSGVMRLQVGPVSNGLMEMSAKLLDEEADAIARAMTRVERRVPGDKRTKGQRDCDRLMAVILRASEVTEAVTAADARRTA